MPLAKGWIGVWGMKECKMFLGKAEYSWAFCGTLGSLRLLGEVEFIFVH